jgi:hypothetical protein
LNSFKVFLLYTLLNPILPQVSNIVTAPSVLPGFGIFVHLKKEFQGSGEHLEDATSLEQIQARVANQIARAGKAIRLVHYCEQYPDILLY